MRTYNKISERTIEAVVGGAVVEMGPKAVVKCSDDIITLFFMDKEYSYPNDIFAVNNINGEIGRYFYEKDAYVLDLPTRFEVYDDPKEYEDAKNEMAMQMMYTCINRYRRILFDGEMWDEENASVTVSLCMFDDQKITIEYKIDEDKIVVTDEYYNNEEFTYCVEDEDWFVFRNDFMDTLKKVVAKTAARYVDGITY
jgi:hypothetical protein